MPADILALEIAPEMVQLLAVAVLFFWAGAAAPTYYAQERLRGFGRALLGRLPYQAPPGMSEEEALEAAVESAEEQEAEDGEE